MHSAKRAAFAPVSVCVFRVRQTLVVVFRNDPETVGGRMPFEALMTSGEELDRAIQQLLVNACEHDVNPAGSWVVRNGKTLPDWEVQVSKLTKQS